MRQVSSLAHRAACPLANRTKTVLYRIHNVCKCNLYANRRRSEFYRRLTKLPFDHPALTPCMVGELVIRSNALGEDNSLNTVLRAYDADRQKISSNNNFRDRLDSRIVLSVVEGKEYTVQLSSVGGTYGDYRVSLRFKDDSPNGGGFGDFGRELASADIIKMGRSPLGLQRLIRYLV